MTISQTTAAAIRFGYGFHPRQTPPADAADLLHQLRQGAKAPLALPIPDAADRRAQLQKLIKARRAKRDKDEIRAMVRQIRRGAAADVGRRVFQRALSPHGFFERMAAFWADHFSISARRPVALLVVPMFEVEAIRPHVTGRFGDMLKAVVRHPVMLHYLDQTVSMGPNSRAGKRSGRGLNENLAREILELHTLGVGGPYSQTDVRELAELLTGYGIQRRDLSFHFFPQRVEPGAEFVLGKRYGGDPGRPEDVLEALDDLARHPVTAHHIAGKLAVHFVADDPDPDLVTSMARAFRRSGGDLPGVYEAMLAHPSAWAGFGAKIKRPVDLVASTLRAIGVDRTHAEPAEKRGREILQALRAMNQPMFGAPGPDGWPEEAAAWITPQGLAARLKYASHVGQLIAKRADADPRLFAQAELRDALREDTRFAVSAAAERWEGFAFTLASPEFNRR